MRAGILKEVVDIYRPTVTTNTLGEQTTAYSKVHTYRARVVHRNHDRENFEGDIRYPNQQNLQLRIYCDIEDNDIIKFQGRYYRLTQAPLIDRDLQCMNLIITQVVEDITIITPTQTSNEQTNG